ncbi:DUF3017 domain-containing protein [Streptomyces sulfonofaciens]|uniref:DUF3017 domain-containing protein n=1 Tax=Streptomyces sulfonofaciens TaxID=68272 RepID=UPI001E63E75D|nr:DUF3017 domain-containing protein [Streptomyces sulfonofaciens]
MTGEPGARERAAGPADGPAAAAGERVPTGAAASGPADGSSRGAAAGGPSADAAGGSPSDGSLSDGSLSDGPAAGGGPAERAAGPRRASRRFPLFTKDTARPEGGGRAASGDAPAPARQWPVLAVLVLVGTGLLMTAFDLFRGGTLLVGLALIGGAALRWALPSVGMLAVRSRFTDLVTYGVLGTAIALLAMMAQPHPWLEIPFLDDMLHFTIS